MTQFSDKYILSLHRFYVRSKSTKHREAAPQLEIQILQRIPLSHLWEIEKLQLDLLKKNP